MWCLSWGGLLSWGMGHLWGWSCCSLQWPVNHPIHYFISDHFLLCPQRSDHNLCNLIRDFLYVISIFLDLNSVVLEGTAHPFIGVLLSIIHNIPVLSFSNPKNLFLSFSKPSSPHTLYAGVILLLEKIERRLSWDMPSSTWEHHVEALLPRKAGSREGKFWLTHACHHSDPLVGPSKTLSWERRLMLQSHH
jgi:hypothetical protein